MPMDKDKEFKIILAYMWTGLIYLAISIPIVLTFEKLLLKSWGISVYLFLMGSFAVWSIVSWVITLIMFKSKRYHLGWWFTVFGISFTGVAIITGWPHFYGDGVPFYIGIILPFVSLLPLEIYRRRTQKSGK